MKPVPFPQQNCTYAENQPDYLPLPAYRDPAGTVVSCWHLTWRERLRVLLTGKLLWMQLTFNEPLQPQRPYVKSPFP